MQIIYKLLLISFIIVLFQGCGGVTPSSNETIVQNNGIGQYPETKYLYVKNNVATQNNKPKAETAKHTNVNENRINEITWGGDINIDTSLYLESLQEYVKKELPSEYHNTYQYYGDAEYTSSYPMAYSEASKHCADRGGTVKYSDYYNKYPYIRGVVQCINVRREKVILKDTNTIKFYDFLTDQEKLSIFTNYLITKTYNLKKDKFEKTSAFQERVSYVKDNIKSITNKYMSIAYNTVYGEPIIEQSNYDADNELFYGILKSSKGTLSEKIAVNIPLDIAKDFYYAHKEAKVIYQYKDEKVYLQNIIISYKNKDYMAVLNKMNYKPNDLKVALYEEIKYGETLIAKLNNDIPELLKKSETHITDKNKWLFIIGIENYEYTDSVKYSTNSAKGFKDVMQKRLGIAENNVRTLLDRGATSSQIDYKLKDMLRQVKKGDTIYFYYSGHGIPVPTQNNEPYMLAQDMNPAYLNDERFKLQTIYKELSNSKASKIIAFIDSCFSGGTDNQSLIKGVAATRVKPKSVTFDNNKMLVISAGSGTQYSNKYDEKTNRLFSYYLMKGLLSNNTDTQRLYDYIKSNVQEKSYEMGPSYEQVPVYDGNIKLKL